MKKLSIFVAFCTLALATSAQLRFPETDKSPLDESYYPNNYPLLKIQGKSTEPLIARVIYSRPQKNNRVIFGELGERGNRIGRLARICLRHTSQEAQLRIARVGCQALVRLDQRVGWLARLDELRDLCVVVGMGHAGADQRGQRHQAQEAWECAADLLHGRVQGSWAASGPGGAYTAADCS